MSALCNEVCIVGIGQTPFVRGSEDPSQPLRVELQAAEAAINTASASLRNSPSILVSVTFPIRPPHTSVAPARVLRSPTLPTPSNPASPTTA